MSIVEPTSYISSGSTLHYDRFLNNSIGHLFTIPHHETSFAMTGNSFLWTLQTFRLLDQKNETIFLLDIVNKPDNVTYLNPNGWKMIMWDVCTWN